MACWLPKVRLLTLSFCCRQDGRLVRLPEQAFRRYITGVRERLTQLLGGIVDPTGTADQARRAEGLLALHRSQREAEERRRRELDAQQK